MNLSTNRDHLFIVSHNRPKRGDFHLILSWVSQNQTYSVAGRVEGCGVVRPVCACVCVASMCNVAVTKKNCFWVFAQPLFPEPQHITSTYQHISPSRRHNHQHITRQHINTSVHHVVSHQHISQPRHDTHQRGDTSVSAYPHLARISASEQAFCQSKFGT